MVHRRTQDGGHISKTAPTQRDTPMQIGLSTWKHIHTDVVATRHDQE